MIPSSSSSVSESSSSTPPALTSHLMSGRSHSGSSIALPVQLPILDLSQSSKVMKGAVMYITPVRREVMSRFCDFMPKSVQNTPKKSDEEIATDFHEGEAALVVHSAIQDLTSLGAAGDTDIQMILANRASGQSWTTLLIALRNHVEVPSSTESKGKTRLHRLRSSWRSSTSLKDPLSMTRQKIGQTINQHLDATKLPLVDWTRQYREDAWSQSRFLAFTGSWESPPIPAGVATVMWPPIQSLSYTQHEFHRSMLGLGSSVQRESIKLVGRGKVIDLLDRYSKENGIIRIAPEQFFVDLVSQLHAWLQLPVDEELCRTIYSELLAAAPTTPSESEAKEASGQLAALGLEPTSEAIANWIYMLRVTPLVQKYPVIRLLGLMTIRANAGCPMVYYQYLPELFTNNHAIAFSHLYSSKQDHVHSTHITCQLPTSDAPHHRVTQTTRWSIHRHQRAYDGDINCITPPVLATFEMLWTVGMVLTEPESPLRYTLTIRRLKFLETTHVEDRCIISHVFDEAMRRYRDVLSHEPIERAASAPAQSQSSSSSSSSSSSLPSHF